MSTPDPSGTAAAPEGRPRRLVGVSLKMYFGLARTRAYLADVAALGEHAAACGVDAFVIPDFVSLATGAELLAGSGVALGAQDAFWEDAGAYTGEVSPAVLREVGCTFVELGHAERRRLFGEDDEVTARKAAAAARNGLVPLVCIGETTREGSGAQAVERAVAECRPQVESVLAAVPDDSEVVLAYEPVWAIGQPEPASADHVVAVTRRLREIAGDRAGTTRILYGGSAGPGLFASLAEGVDGLFLGRFAHDVAAFRSVITELGA
ncbi:triosephosphate isomerase [Kineococcus xinjiangensis]|uniref:Triosephosphate isomerase n=1 Tax=Kineococcus xinjiangensis TaxID=512762 RepID=A0A2S6IKA2_9ACTN|nr:triose-phosphate isomerase family protein [Kineococcus xinjiangensis]PPK94628.1 triosephosphate isomerase [Kineococcus xinjiangensis]